MDTAPSYWSKRRKIMKSVNKIMTAIDKESASCNTETLNQHFENINDTAHVEKVNCVDSQFSRNQNVLDYDNESELNKSLDVIIKEHDRITYGQTLLNDNENNDGYEWDRYMQQDEMEDCDVESLSENESDESEIDDRDKIKNNEKCLAFELGMWAASFSVSMVAFSSLLSILRVFHPSLPKDPRTILKTPRVSNVRVVEGGSYFHFGIVKSLQHVRHVTQFFKNVSSEVPVISLQINLDGLPLHKSTTHQFWPILAKVSKPFNSDPFLIGLFCGLSKPVNLDEYLRDFIEEMLELEKGPVSLYVDGKSYYANINISCFICDTPARAYVKQIKGHSGYYGCDKCTQKGEWNNKVTFPSTNAPLRTDQAFNQMTDLEHHIGVTPLKTLSIGMVTQFPLDYMHLVCLGVMKRILMFLLKSPVREGIRIGQISINGISKRLFEFRTFIPREFSRKCRPLSDIERWKAVEFRQFLLYSGIVALKGHLSNAVYKNFLLFFVGIHCLASPDLFASHADYAATLLRAFVENAINIYGRGFISYNVHGLIHIAEDVKKYGSLDNYSAFPFENFLGHLKHLIRKPQLPLQQVIRRISEKNGSIIRNSCKSLEEGIPRKLHHQDPIILNKQSNCLQFKEIFINGLFYSTSEGNNCVKIYNEFCVIRNILKLDSDKNHWVVYEHFLTIEPFFNYPANSLENFDIVKASILSNHYKTARVDEIQRKYVMLPYQTKFILIPLSHANQSPE